MTKMLLSLAQVLFWSGLFLIPTAIVVWRVSRAKREYEAEAKEPFTDLPLRLPGESTREVADKHWEKAMDWFLALIAASTFLGFAVTQMQPRGEWLGIVLLALLMIGIAGVAGPKVLKSLREHWKYQLGFKGERVVAEELNQLLSQGWRVFHDVPFPGFNVDHVAVGPVGVFAIETKARRKWRNRKTVHPPHIVKWDGAMLTWPSGAKNQDGVDQAERNAATVAEFLSRSTGEPVQCKPVLTFPGWWVEVGGRGATIVASTKGLHKVLPICGGAGLTAPQMQRIVFQLEQRCRPDPKTNA